MEIDYDTNLINNSILKIRLRGIENITNLSDIFFACRNLYS